MLCSGPGPELMPGCQTECQKRRQIEYQTICQKVCQNRTPDRMSVYNSIHPIFDNRHDFTKPHFFRCFAARVFDAPGGCGHGTTWHRSCQGLAGHRGRVSFYNPKNGDDWAMVFLFYHVLPTLLAMYINVPIENHVLRHRCRI